MQGINAALPCDRICAVLPPDLQLQCLQPVVQRQTLVQINDNAGKQMQRQTKRKTNMQWEIKFATRLTLPCDRTWVALSAELTCGATKIVPVPATNTPNG